MTHNHTIFYDVTQLVHWPGKLTGIPRVMNELAIKFDSDKHVNTVFVSWVKELEAFCEVDFEHSVLNRGKGLVYKKTQGEENPNKRPLKQSKSRHLKRVAKASIRVGAKVSPKIADSLENRAKLALAASYKRADFKAGDIIFVPWGEWWDVRFINLLKRLHNEQNVKIVHILHDMTPIVVPQFSGHSTDSFPIYCREILPICDLVLANSQASKQDATAWLEKESLPVPPFGVFRLGDNFEAAKSLMPHEDSFKNSGLKGGDYILCVGTFEARKNHTLLYYVYKLALYRDIKLPKIVIVGRIGWGTEQVYNMMSNDPTIKDDFVFLHDASDQELSWLYDHALFTVFPSFYEGWGIPIAESVSRGIPCLCSNTSSMVEIAEGFVEHASPYSPEEYLASIQKLLDADNLVKARTKASGYRTHTWEESYNQVKNHLVKVL